MLDADQKNQKKFRDPVGTLSLHQKTICFRQAGGIRVPWSRREELESQTSWNSKSLWAALSVPDSGQEPCSIELEKVVRDDSWDISCIGWGVWLREGIQICAGEVTRWGSSRHGRGHDSRLRDVNGVGIFAGLIQSLSDKTEGIPPISLIFGQDSNPKRSGKKISQGIFCKAS